MKNLPLLLLVIFSFNTVKAQTYFPSLNMTSTVLAVSDNSNLQKSLEVKFEVQNDSVVLIDNFQSWQKVVDFFYHTDINTNTINIDYAVEGNEPNYTFGACLPGTNTSLQTITYTFNLFHKDSFSSKIINYKGKTYSLTNDAGQWDYFPKEKDYSTDLFTNELSSGNFQQSLNSCPANIEIIGDSIIVKYTAFHPWGKMQIIETKKFSTSDSLALTISTPCGNLYPAADWLHCYKIYVGDTLRTTSLDIEVSNADNYPLAPSFLHYERTASGIIAHPVAALPVEGLLLNAIKGTHYNQLIWETLNEENTSHFKVLKSYDGSNFFAFGKIQASVNSDSKKTYTFQDNNIDPKNEVYYRVDLYDIDGTPSVSNTVYLNETSTNELSIYPNPSQGVIYIDGLQGEDYEFSLKTFQGKIIEYNFQLVNNQLDLSRIAKGLYILTIKNVNAEISINKKIMLQ